MAFKDINKKRAYQKKIAREWARKHPEKIKASREKFKKTNPEKRNAWRKVETIKIPYGQLCQRCVIREAVDRHHKDYSKPMEFEFLCKICHAQADKERKQLEQTPEETQPASAVREESETSGDFPIVIDEASKNGLNKAMNLIKDNRDFCLSDNLVEENLKAIMSLNGFDDDIPLIRLDNGDTCSETIRFYYRQEDVKEFVRRLKEELFFYPKQLSDNEMIIIIDKLCGEKLL